VPPRLAEELDEPAAKPVVPGPRELDHLLLELGERDLGRVAKADVDGEVDLRELALAEREVVLDGRGLEAPDEQLLESVPELGVERVAGHHHEQGDVVPDGVPAQEEPDLALLLEVEQPHHLPPELVGRGGEQLGLRKLSKIETTAL